MSVQDNPEIELRRPDNAVTGVLAGQPELDVAVAELQALGVPPEHVSTLHGDVGVTNFDVEGQHHGRWAHLVRAWKNMGGSDANLLSAYDAALKAGGWLVDVPVVSGSKDDIVELLRHQRATGLAFFDGGSMETIPSE